MRQTCSPRWRRGSRRPRHRSPTAAIATHTSPARSQGAEYPQHCRVLLPDPAGDGDWRADVDLGAEPQVILDPAELADQSGYLDIGLTLVSPDERLLAYSFDRTGDEVYRMRIRDLDTGRDLPDELPRTYYTRRWSADSSTLFYTVHDEIYRPYPGLAPPARHAGRRRRAGARGARRAATTSRSSRRGRATSSSSSCCAATPPRYGSSTPTHPTSRRAASSRVARESSTSSSTRGPRPEIGCSSSPTTAPRNTA